MMDGALNARRCANGRTFAAVVGLKEQARYSDQGNLTFWGSLCQLMEQVRVERSRHKTECRDLCKQGGLNDLCCLRFGG